MTENRIDKFLAVFYRDILDISAEPHDNIILTGSNVLELHGLNISWHPQDLDIAIYQPTKQQEKWVRDSVNGYEPCMLYEDAEKLGTYQRAWKKIRPYEDEELVINFILEKQPRPVTNLIYKFRNLYLPVQNIDTIINAKLSYGQGKDKSFLRRKDAYHLSELKRLNFNVTLPVSEEEVDTTTLSL